MDLLDKVASERKPDLLDEVVGNFTFDMNDPNIEKKVSDAMFFASISQKDPNDVWDYIDELNVEYDKIANQPSRTKDISKKLKEGWLKLKALPYGIASIGTQIGQQMIENPISFTGEVGLATRPQELSKQAYDNLDKTTKEKVGKYENEIYKLYSMAQSPELAMSYDDIWADLTSLIFANAPQMIASAAAGLVGGAPAVFATTMMMEGMEAREGYLIDRINKGYELTEQDYAHANLIGGGVGIITAIPETLGFKGVENIFEKAALKYKSKLIQAGYVVSGSMITESITETLQEVPHLAAEATYRLDEMDWNEVITRLVGSAAGGATLGAFTTGSAVGTKRIITGRVLDTINNLPDAKSIENMFNPEPTVSQPTESITQTEPTTTNVTQAPTPAVEPQTMAEGEVVEPKIGDLVELEKNVFKQIDEKDIINEKDGTITFKYPDRNGKEISKTVKFGEVNFVKPPETSIPINRVESLKTYAPSWLTGELLDKWSKGEITDEDVVSTVLDKNAKTPEQKALLRNKNMEERFLDNGARIIYFPDLNKEFNIGTGSHIDALDRARQEAYGDLQKTKDIVDSLFQPTPPVSEPQTPADAGKGMLEGTVVSDLKGNPTVVYHGTDKQFDTFGGSEHGLYYFTEKEDYAKKYAHDKGLVKKAFLNIKNPLEISDFDLSENYTTLSNFVEELEYASNNKTFAESVKNEWEATYGEEDEFYRWEIVATQEFRDLLIKYGYDGIRASEGFTNIWVTVSPEQIIENKSSFTPPVEVQPEKVKTITQQADEQVVKINTEQKPKPLNLEKMVDEELPSARGARNEDVKRERRILGLEEIASPTRKSNKTSFDNAIKKGIPEKSRSIATDILAKKRLLTDEDEAGMRIQLSKLEKQSQDIISRIDKATDPQDIQQLASEKAHMYEEMDLISQALTKGGTDIARALQIRQALLELEKDTYSLSYMRAEIKAAKGQDLTAQESKKIEELSSKMRELEAKIAEQEATIKELQAKATLKKRGYSKYGEITKEQLNIEKTKTIENIRELLKQGCF